MFGVLRGPKKAENGRKRPKMNVHKWALFEEEKNTIFEFGKNGPNEAHRTPNDVVKVWARPPT